MDNLAVHKSFWQGRRVLVSGGGGFIGSWVVEALRRRGVAGDHIMAPRSAQCDLRLLKNCRTAVRGCDIVIHLAARTGSIAFSRGHPASQYRDCALINLHLLEAAREASVEKFVSLGNLFAYPANAVSPLREENLHDGRVANSHLGVGLAKRDLIALGEMYHREHGMNAVGVIAANAYGPRDRFEEAHSHVIPATIMKCFRDEDLVVWGDGTPTRDFLHAEDIAEGILLAAEHLQAPACINLSSGAEISIRHLVELIAGLCSFRRKIVFDPSKGGGDPRRLASAATAKRLTGFSPKISLEDGLRRTIDWYRENRAAR